MNARMHVNGHKVDAVRRNFRATSTNKRENVYKVSSELNIYSSAN